MYWLLSRTFTSSLYFVFVRLNSATNKVGIDEILDRPCYEYILKSCRWDMTKSVMSQNKVLFLQQLLFEEVVEKRNTIWKHSTKAWITSRSVIWLKLTLEFVSCWSWQNYHIREIFKPGARLRPGCGCTPECFQKSVCLYLSTGDFKIFAMLAHEA